jgi:leader peptidase (prepilin peptidase)/N-methyltransferase
LGAAAQGAVYSTSRMIRIIGTIFAGLLGLAFGSFLNVCLSRWPAGESVVSPSSHCRNCDHRLAWWENVPLVSWMALRGQCRKCHSAISWRYPLVELAVACLWTAPAWQFFGEVPNPDLPSVYLCDDLLLVFAWMLFYFLVIALAVLDAELLWLPDRITLTGIAIGCLFSPLHEYLLAVSPMKDDLAQTTLHVVSWAIASNLLNIAVSAGLILLIRWLYKLIRKREGMGLGDAKLMAMLAAWLGLPGALLAFGLGAVLGSVVALALLTVPAARRGSESWGGMKLPFGTFLCIGGIVSSLWGQSMIAAYLRWAGL